ncbi:MAG: S41 family peptidase [Nitrososphaerota archaeon]
MNNFSITHQPDNANQRKKFIIWFLITAFVFFVIGWQFGSDFSLAQQARNKSRFQEAERNVDFTLFWQVWDIVADNYFDKSAINPQKLLWGAISGMVRAVGDPYTVFLPPEENKIKKDELEGKYSGVGIELGFKDNKLVVIAPLSGTPAELAGIKAGDFILKIDDTDTDDLSLAEAAKMIRGPVGTKVRLTLMRGSNEKPFELELTRAEILVKSVGLKIIDVGNKKAAIISLSRFGEKTNEEWDSIISEAVNNGARGYILDLRNNPGGFLNSAIYVASEFLDGAIVGQLNSDGKTQFFNAERTGRLLAEPLVVIINKGSASASEIVAGAVKVRGRGKVVGEVSFGKGTIQDTHELTDGSSVHVTIAQWLLPDGQQINGKGVTPDIEISLTEDDLNQNRDVQLDKAIEILSKEL